MTTKTEQITAIVARRYPCRALPYGALTDIANEVGCTTELVRQVANRTGATKRIYADRRCPECLRDRGGRAIPNRPCRECGKKARRVTLPCTACGTSVVRLVSEVAGRAHHINPITRTAGGTAEYTGRVFCNRTCFGLWAGRNFGRNTAYQTQMTDAEREEKRLHA